MRADAIRKLEAMGVPVWQQRRPRPAAPSSRTGRIRLEAGSGRWLLVVDEIERAEHEALLGDVVAALGAPDCRFGTWSDSPDSGVGPEDWAAHGIEHVVVAGAWRDAPEGCIRVESLDELAASARARRDFWGALRARLEA